MPDAWPTPFRLLPESSGAVLSGNIASGQVGPMHHASGALAAALGALGSAVAFRSLSGLVGNNSGAIATVSGTGLYRVAAYAEVMLGGGVLNLGNLSVRLDWADEGKAQNVSPITGVALATSGAFSQGTVTLRALSGTPIIMTVTFGSLTGSPTCNAYGALERLT